MTSSHSLASQLDPQVTTNGRGISVNPVPLPSYASATSPRQYTPIPFVAPVPLTGPGALTHSMKVIAHDTGCTLATVVDIGRAVRDNQESLNLVVRAVTDIVRASNSENDDLEETRVRVECIEELVQEQFDAVRPVIADTHHRLGVALATLSINESNAVLARTSLASINTKLDRLAETLSRLESANAGTQASLLRLETVADKHSRCFIALGAQFDVMHNSLKSSFEVLHGKIDFDLGHTSAKINNGVETTRVHIRELAESMGDVVDLITGHTPFRRSPPRAPNPTPESSAPPSPTGSSAVRTQRQTRRATPYPTSKGSPKVIALQCTGRGCTC